MEFERITQLGLVRKKHLSTRVMVFDYADSLLQNDVVSGIESVLVVKQNQVGGSSPLTVETQSFTDTQIQVKVSGGTEGEFYRISVFANTSPAGEKLCIEGMVTVA